MSFPGGSPEFLLLPFIVPRPERQIVARVSDLCSSRHPERRAAGIYKVFVPKGRKVLNRILCVPLRKNYVSSGRCFPGNRVNGAGSASRSELSVHVSGNTCSSCGDAATCIASLNPANRGRHQSVVHVRRSPVWLAWVACRTRASTTLPVCSALMAKCKKPLTVPLSGRLKISQSTSRPLPASPMHPVPIPPRGKEMALVWRPV